MLHATVCSDYHRLVTSMPITPNASLTDQVVAAVRDAIDSGSLAPDQLYSAYQLAEQLQVSRSPVREALLRLSEAGVVQLERNRGFRVVLPRPQDIAEIFAVRLALEIPAVRRVAATADHTLIDALKHQAATMRELASSEDEPAFARHDQHLHEAILVAAGNRRATGIVRSMRDATRLLGASTAYRTRSLAEIDDEHRPVIEAIGDGDPEAAEKAMRWHLTHTGQLLVSQAIVAQGTNLETADLWARVVG